MSRLEFLAPGKPRQFDRIVFVSFAFDVSPSPRIFVRAADKCFEPQFLAQIVNPTTGAASFHHDKIEPHTMVDAREIRVKGLNDQMYFFSAHLCFGAVDHVGAYQMIFLL